MVGAEIAVTRVWRILFNRTETARPCFLFAHATHDLLHVQYHSITGPIICDLIRSDRQIKARPCFFHRADGRIPWSYHPATRTQNLTKSIPGGNRFKHRYMNSSLESQFETFCRRLLLRIRFSTDERPIYS